MHGLIQSLSLNDRQPRLASSLADLGEVSQCVHQCHKLSTAPCNITCIGTLWCCPAGVDVSALLSKVGINASATSEKVGTVAIAYAAHKALSPVRFPPTVALTPVVARFLGNKGQQEDPESNVSNGDGPSP